MLSKPNFPKRNPGDTPPEYVRFIELRVEPWEDGQRVRILVDITPFRESPDLEAAIFNACGEEISNAVIIGSSEHRMVFTMHLRCAGRGPYTLRAELHYPNRGLVDSRSVTFDLLGSLPSETGTSGVDSLK